ncbi:MAG: HAD family hydrolase [Thermoplasmata archaeon]|nr:HAD family hydrolase [Thermoplasmata archaeon]
MTPARTSEPKETTSPPRPHITTVFFDLGGTLVDERDILGWTEEALRLGLDIPPDDLAHAYADVLRATDCSPRATLEEFWRRVLEQGSQRAVAPALTERFLSAYLASERPLPLFSDTRRCLEDLAADGRNLAIISNSRGEDHVREILIRRDIAQFFGTIVSSGTEGVAKPDPEIFRRALRRAHAAPEASFYVGDLAFTDAKAAAGVGIHSVWLNRWGTGFGDDPPEITSLLEVPICIDQIETGR